MIALSGHTRVAFVGDRSCTGALPPWLWRVRRSARLGGLGSRCPASLRAQHSAMCRARALRVSDPDALRVTELGALRCIEPVLCESPSPASVMCRVLSSWDSCNLPLLQARSLASPLHWSSPWIEKPDEQSLYSCVASLLGGTFLEPSRLRRDFLMTSSP